MNSPIGAFAINQELICYARYNFSVVQATLRNSVPAVSPGTPFQVVIAGM